jgi:hypothetical protein
VLSDLWVTMLWICYGQHRFHAIVGMLKDFVNRVVAKRPIGLGKHGRCALAPAPAEAWVGTESRWLLSLLSGVVALRLATPASGGNGCQTKG